MLLDARDAYDQVGDVHQVDVALVGKLQQVDHLAERVALPLSLGTVVEVQLGVLHRELLVRLVAVQTRIGEGLGESPQKQLR